jgi:hypothetical protein
VIRDHERLEELIAVRALGGLDPDDERAYEQERAAHGADCVECRRLETEYGEVAGRIAFSLDPEPASPELEDRVVGLATGSVAVLERVTPRQAARARRRFSAGGVVLRPLVAAAAAVVVFVGGWAAGSLTSDETPPVPSDARVVAFEGEGGGTLAVAYRPGEAGVYLLGSGLDTPPEGRVYEVWMIRDGTPIPGPCVTPQPDGSLFAFADAELGTTETMAVTVERASCPTAPTTDPVFTATITA